MPAVASHVPPPAQGRSIGHEAAPPAVEPGRLHEVLGHGGVTGIGAAMAWLTEGVGVERFYAWIGRAIWPACEVLRRCGLLDRTLLIQTRTAAECAWAAELCVRCDAVAAVVTDGRGIDLTMTRRLQLAARGRDCRLIMLRPAVEAEASVAGSRWTVEPTPASGDLPRRPRWNLDLIRSKGTHQTTETAAPATPRGERPAGLRTAGEMFCNAITNGDLGLTGETRWTYEWDPRRGRPLCVPVDLPADLAGRSAAATMAWTG